MLFDSEILCKCKQTDKIIFIYLLFFFQINIIPFIYANMLFDLQYENRVNI